MAANREAVRDAFATLLQTALVGTGKPVQEVVNYRKGDLEGKSPVVQVSSYASNRSQMTARGGRTTVYLLVAIFVLYALEDGTWTEAQAEDALDQIESLIAEVVRSNQATANWGALDYESRSERVDAAIGGQEYIVEAVTLKAEVYG